MNYLITGGTGFIGTALIASLRAAGHGITVLTRQPRPPQEGVSFVTSLDAIPAQARFDGVVNLAGASLAGARWSESYKREITSSRLDTTGAVITLLGRLQKPPAVLLSASAIGYYGHHGDEALGEDGAVVPGFSQQLCQRWEAEALRAEALGTRVCLLRFGVVLDRDGGAMEQMAQPFRLGIANWLGSGQQWLSWVHRKDAVAAMDFLLARTDLSGPFNITAPEPVTSRGFCAAMKRRRRTLLTAPVPAPVMRLLVGEMAQELLLQGQRVLPLRLQAEGFRFSFPTLDDALGAIMARQRGGR
jgi:uncharacterized protein (TIGR01777 family)